MPSAPISSPVESAQATPTQLERTLYVVLLLAVVVLGVVTEIRSAFMRRRMTDLDVYLRAAWAVRTSQDLYTVTDDNGWHYHYPPLLAILLTPLADPPDGADTAGFVPFPVTVALWYLLNVGCLVFGVHHLAKALEEHSQSKPSGRRWWALRLWPILVCMVPIGHSLARGQVNLILFALLCGVATAWLRRQQIRAGMWLAAAICLKVIPAFLLLFFLWRRSWRGVLGCGLGLAVGMLLVPVLCFGPERTVQLYRQWNEVLFQPALGQGSDRSRARELIDITATASQSFLAVMHNTIHLDRDTRPSQATPILRQVHWTLILGLTGLVFLRRARQRGTTAVHDVLGYAALCLLMLLASPVCHLHYFCLAVIPVMAWLQGYWEFRPASLLPGRGCQFAAFLILLALLLPQLPGLEMTRDVGLSMYGVLLIWIFVVVGPQWSFPTSTATSEGCSASDLALGETTKATAAMISRNASPVRQLGASFK